MTFDLGITDIYTIDVIKINMNLEGYFERISYNGHFHKADLGTQKNVQRLHVLSIPFENLSCKDLNFCLVLNSVLCLSFTVIC